ncbi:MAG: OsmC family protein [Candidatus Dormibacteria bacterium]
MKQTAPTRNEDGVAPAAPTTYRVSARTEGNGRAVAEAADESIAFDASWAQPPSGLPGPAELLASAFAACLLKNIERAGHLLSFRYESAEVDVIVRRQDAPPMFTEIAYELRVATDESDHRLELLHRNLRQFGTVYNTLAAACAIDGRIARFHRDTSD